MSAESYARMRAQLAAPKARRYAILPEQRRRLWFDTVDHSVKETQSGHLESVGVEESIVPFRVSVRPPPIVAPLITASQYVRITAPLSLEPVTISLLGDHSDSGFGQFVRSHAIVCSFEIRAHPLARIDDILLATTNRINFDIESQVVEGRRRAGGKFTRTGEYVSIIAVYQEPIHLAPPPAQPATLAFNLRSEVYIAAGENLRIYLFGEAPRCPIELNLMLYVASSVRSVVIDESSRVPPPESS